MTDHVEVRSGAYYDSVTLMQVSRQVQGAQGVVAAQVAMATELNLDVTVGMGFAVPAAVVPNDLLVAIRADSDEGVAHGLATLGQVLTDLQAAASQSGGFGETPPPRTLGAAIAAGGATLALVSVPGEHATTEAFDAISRGVSVMLFSDNVPVEDEVRLKDAAAAADVLVMGPDCGTAVVGGVALGFANVVARGPIGIVAASGTGAQQVLSLLDAAGVGVSHCLGVGGRDLSAAVAGRSSRQALAALAADEDTEAIVVVSKPPAPEVLADLQRYAAGLGTPVYWATLGAGRPDLTEAVEAVLAATGNRAGAGAGAGPGADAGPGAGAHSWPAWTPTPPASLEVLGGDRPDKSPKTPGAEGAEGAAGGGGEGAAGGGGAGRYLRGLFCGGTLADEAMLVASAELGGVGLRSNIPLTPELALPHDLRASDHLVIDFGDDGLTRGRAHPMIDPSLRTERIGVEAADPTCGVLLLDLVLGHGAHPDPGPELADAVRSARAAARADGRHLPVVVSVTGTQRDPQGLERTAQALADAGAWVFLSNAAATRKAVAFLVAHDHDEVTA